METVLFSSLKKEDLIKTAKASALQSQKDFLNSDALGMIYMGVEGDQIRAERMLLIPRVFKPVFVGTLEEDGAMTKITGEMGMSPGAKILASMCFWIWILLGGTILLLAKDATAAKLGIGFGPQFTGHVLAGIVAFFVVPRILVSMQRKDTSMILAYLAKAIDVKGMQ